MNEDEDSIKELYDRVDEGHPTPVAQALHKVKVEAVYKMLEMAQPIKA
jgi:hypothetical protein